MRRDPGFCACGHVVDRSWHHECRHCVRARMLIKELDPRWPENARPLEWARERLARHTRGADVMRAPMFLDALVRAARTVRPS